MATLIWQAPMRYFSARDEAALFSWLQSISGVVSVQGYGRELHIRLRSKKLSEQSLRELLALYQRYQGNMSELAQFANQANSTWFADPNACWYSQVFGSRQAA